MTTEPPPSGPVRRTTDLRRAYFDAAHEILSTDGYGGLKLAPLCRRLSVTTGSFYHSFASWGEFTTALLDDWRRERTTQVVEIARAEADPVARLELLASAGADLLHRTEAAIRVWSAVDPAVAQIQQQVDDERYAVVREAVASLVGDDPDDGADRFAGWAFSTLVGHEALSDRFEPADLAWSLQQILAAALARRTG